MPLYNGLEFLDESVNSIVNQTNTKWELIIGINGHQGSDAGFIIQKIKAYKDKRIKAILCSVKGKSKTLNSLTWHAQHEYVCVLDVDDKWLPTKLEKQLPLMKKYDVVGADVEYFGDKTGTPGLFLGKLSPIMFSYQNPIINSAVMLKKCDAWWDPNWEGLDDYNLWIELLRQKRSFYNIPEILVNHRLHDKSYFNNKNDEMANKLLREKIKKMSEHEYNELGKIMDNKSWVL
jgi:teichuronic acid biosynthesis glycosyltransferase TuaG